MNEFETARLHLRMFAPGDLDELCPIFSDPRVVKYMKDGAPISRQETELALISIIKHWEQNGFGRWAVVHKKTQRLIGYGGLRNLYGMPELVYLLAYPYWGRGLATEIARACLDWGFEKRRFKRIIAVAKPDNLASRRVMEKVGMNYEKDANYYGIDCVFYAVARQTYRALHCLEQRLPLERLVHNHLLERHSRG